MFILFSLEFGLNNLFCEIKAGGRKKFQPYKNAFIHGDIILNSNGALGDSIHGSINHYSSLQIQLGAIDRNAHTLEGERNFPYYKSELYDLKVWAKISLIY